MNSTREVLCQNCLRGLPDPDGKLHEDREAACPFCGGETCGCRDCLHCLALLRAGVRDRQTVGLKGMPGDLISWAEDRGLYDEGKGLRTPLRIVWSGSSVSLPEKAVALRELGENTAPAVASGFNPLAGRGRVLS